MIQALLDATPLDGICTLPGGIVDVPADTRYTVPRAMTINGNDTTVHVAGSTMPTVPLFDLSPLPDGADVTIRNLTIVGPDCTARAAGASPSVSAIDWTLARTWNSSLTTGTGFKYVSGSWALTAGIWWIGFVAQVTSGSPTFGTAIPAMPVPSTDTTHNGSKFQNSVSGSLPDPAVPGAANTTSVPIIFLYV